METPDNWPSVYACVLHDLFKVLRQYLALALGAFIYQAEEPMREFSYSKIIVRGWNVAKLPNIEMRPVNFEFCATFCRS